MEGPHKVLVIGDAGIGKTSLIRRYVDGVFNKYYSATLGVDFALKAVEWEKGQQVRLQLWDIAGQERFSGMTRVYYKQATACVIVFDITRKVTFEHVQKWKADLASKVQLDTGDPVPCLLIANKCDLPDRPVSTEEITAFVESNGFIGWIETSAMEDTNVDKAMRFLIQHIVALYDDETPAPTQEDLIRLNTDQGAGGGCCK